MQCEKKTYKAENINLMHEAHQTACMHFNGGLGLANSIF